ncbi:dephospho-CoA kinase [Desulfobacterales bacterium HSG2]|nr:dephospho-CoA kinase [Desulfobacterales bacterium HSG2]
MKNNCLLLGVTGGIASGKTTVAKMLEELGAPAIDFDLLARQVVEPGTPALKKIVDYFGDQAIHEDGTLDRKRVSKIVFRDPDKRKVLESFTHPAINEAYFRQVNAISEKKPNAIIQAVIPLLFEFRLEDMVDKILVVYIPREKQIERLTLRDGISKADAENILRAQMPIDEKLRRADFVIRNEGSAEEAMKQAEELWQAMKRTVEERK